LLYRKIADWQDHGVDLTKVVQEIEAINGDVEAQLAVFFREYRSKEANNG
jgi:hypothetical protein